MLKRNQNYKLYSFKEEFYKIIESPSALTSYQVLTGVD